MIIKSTGWRGSDGVMHATLEEAQQAEIGELIANSTSESTDTSKKIAHIIFDHRDKILDILTTTATSKPKARAINGGKKVRKPKVEATLFKEPATNSDM